MEATHQAMGAKLQKICRDHLFSTTEENWLTIRTTMTITIIRTVNDKQTTMQILFWKWNKKIKNKTKIHWISWNYNDELIFWKWILQFHEIINKKKTNIIFKKSCKTKKMMLCRNRNGYEKDRKWKELKKATHE